MKYRIIIERRARKEADSIPGRYRSALDKTIASLAAEPRPYNCKKLTEKEGYRIRVGNYRILYTIDDEMKTVVIYRIKIKGKSVYK